MAVAVDVGHALMAESEHRGVLGACRNLQSRRALQRRNLDLTAKSGCREVNWDFTEEIVILPDEDIVRPDADDDIKIPMRAAPDPRFAVTGTAQPRTVVNAGGDADFDLSTLLGATFSSALLTRIAERLACAIASRAGGGNRKESA